MPELLEVYNLVKHFPVARRLRSRRETSMPWTALSVWVRKRRWAWWENGLRQIHRRPGHLRLIRPAAGQVHFKGEDVLAMDAGQERRMRRQMQMIFQDPFGSLNPRLTVERIVEEPLLTHKVGGSRERRERFTEISRTSFAAETCALSPRVSGGQRQRIMIARALVLQPELIIGDEPVSALDVSVQAQIINLIRLQRQFRFSYLIISHDLSVIRFNHRVAVMYLGQIVEMSAAEDLYESARHPYTLALLSAVPVADPRRKRQRIILCGDVPSPFNPPLGCRFHPRCPQRMALCERRLPSCAGSPKVTWHPAICTAMAPDGNHPHPVPHTRKGRAPTHCNQVVWKHNHSPLKRKGGLVMKKWSFLTLGVFICLALAGAPAADAASETLVVMQEAEPVGLDLMQSSIQTTMSVCYNIHDTLFHPQEDATVLPALAEKWEKVTI